MNRAGAGEKKKRAVWHRDARMRVGEVPFEMWAPPARPTRWELLLRELGLSEMQAREVLLDRAGNGCAPAERIRAFVRRNYLGRFVPEDVLLSLGISISDEEMRNNTRRCDADGD